MFQVRRNDLCRRSPLSMKQIGLVRTSWGGFALYAISKITIHRIYGELVKGCWVGKFVARHDLLKLDATEADLVAVETWKRDKAAAIAAVTAEWDHRFEYR